MFHDPAMHLIVARHRRRELETVASRWRLVRDRVAQPTSAHSTRARAIATAATTRT
jgi:hypothetical protein